MGQIAHDIGELSAEERRMLLAELLRQRAQEVRGHSQETCIHELFEAQAMRTPDRIALIYEGDQLTYQALNTRADQLAHHLRGLGVGPEVLVGIYVERSLDLVVGLLAILKAGGAYLPIDPAYPSERISFMLADAQAPVVLTQRRLLANLPATAAQAICIDTDWGRIAQAQSNPASCVTADNLAYVIYTSGSTGTPKGVLIGHAQVVRLLGATRSWFNFGAQDTWSLFHSAAFDFSVWEIWGALLYGGRLVVVPLWLCRAPDRFLRCLSDEYVTVLNQTPSAFYQLMQAQAAAAQAQPPSLRLVIFGGEALDLSRLQPWLERHGDQRPQLVNMYGITETTVHVTYRRLRMADLAQPRSLIGRPIADLQAYVLDAHQQLVPVGVPGELYIGGAGLARGYLHRPDLTALRFVPNPFGSIEERRLKIEDSQTSDDTQLSSIVYPQSSRLYRTGDRARYLADGELEYLGRVDSQVKIRGFRIELGEIEALLGQHPGVRQCAVILREDQLDDQRLVAYIVPATDNRTGAHVNAPTTDLRAFLQAKLPDYMLPAAFVSLDALPLTANGKLDRRMLPAPGAARPVLERPYAPPRTPIEEEVAAIWRELLGVEQIGIYDSFFEMGGHSLLLTRLAFRLQKSFQVDIPLRTLFEAPTVEGIVLAIAGQQIEQVGADDLGQLLLDLESLSAEEVRALLEGQSHG